MKASLRYEELVTIRVKRETKEAIQRLKGLGVDTGTLLRQAINDYVKQAIFKLESKQD